MLENALHAKTILHVLFLKIECLVIQYFFYPFTNILSKKNILSHLRVIAFRHNDVTLQNALIDEAFQSLSQVFKSLETLILFHYL